MTADKPGIRPGRIALAAILSMAAFFAYGEEYLARDEFLSLAFGEQVPEISSLWLTEQIRSGAKEELGMTPRGLRQRYWRMDSRSAWILEEIGKEKPITIGVVVNDGSIERVEILAFRESRGWEVRYPFFTAQFQGISLGADGYLSQHIDGITGATLSVRAVEKVSRLALWLDSRVRA